MSTDTLTPTLTPSVARLALSYLNAERQAWTDYRAECEEDNRQGYRPHYCFHGTDLWTDYDNICGGCEEEGNWFSFPHAAGRAIDRAKRAQARFDEGFSALMTLQKILGPDTDLFPLALQIRERTIGKSH